MCCCCCVARGVVRLKRLKVALKLYVTAQRPAIGCWAATVSGSFLTNFIDTMEILQYRKRRTVLEGNKTKQKLI